MASKNIFGAGIRFYIDQLQKTLSDEAAVAQGFQNVATAAAGANQQIEQTSMQTLALADGFREIQRGSQRIKQAGMSIIQSMKGFGGEIVQAGAQLQSIEKGYELVFGSVDAAQTKMKAAMDVAAATNLETMQVLQSVPSFQRMGVDALKEYNGQWSENGKMVKGNIGSLVLIADLITGSDQRSENVFRNLNFALKGNAINFKALLDGIESTEEKAAYQAATSAQERMDVIMQITSRLYGGISKSAEGTYAFIMDNIKDITGNIKAMIGKELMPSLTPLVREWLVFISQLKESKEFIAGMKDIAAALVDLLVPIAKFMIGIAKSAVDLVSNNAGLAKILLIMTALSGVLLVIVGTVGGLFATMGLFATVVLPAVAQGLALVKTQLSQIMIRLAPILPYLILIGAAIALAVKAYKENWGGFAVTVDKVGRALKGVFTIFQSWNKGESGMGMDEFKQLKSDGTIDWVIKVGGFLASTWDAAKKAAVIFWEYLKEAWTLVEPAYRQMWLLVQDLFKSFGAFFNLFADEETVLVGAEEDMGGLKSMFDAILPVVKFFGRVMTYVVGAIRLLVNGVRYLIEGVTWLRFASERAGDSLKKYLGDGMDWVAQKVTAAWDWISEKVTSAVTYLKDEILIPLFEFFFGDFDEFQKVMADGFLFILDNVLLPIKDTIAWILDGIGQMVDKVAGLEIPFMDGVTLGDAASATGSALGTAWDAVAEAPGQLDDYLMGPSDEELKGKKNDFQGGKMWERLTAMKDQGLSTASAYGAAALQQQQMNEAQLANAVEKGFSKAIERDPRLGGAR